MKNLIIVESPSKAKTIQKYLGAGFSVIASSGHVRDLPQRTLGIDIENRFEPEYIVTPEKADIIKRLKTAVSKSDLVFLATDPDREGEAISWHLKEELGIPDGQNRIEFHEISKKAVNAAIENPREINMNLVNSQQARRVLDRLVGYKISPVLGKKIKQGLSAGRVQSPALEMIVQRENEIRNFKPEEYWNLAAILVKEGMSKTVKKNLIKAALTEVDNKKYKVENEAQSNRIKDFALNSVYTVDNVKKSQSKSYPAPPFTTSTMTQDASQKLNMTAPDTMRVAQQLYEGIEIQGEGMTALVTYIRTDSVRVSPDFQFRTLDYIKSAYGDDYAPKKPNFYKTKGDAQDAHEAIRPISLEVTPASIKDKIKPPQYRLYKLIYERYLASQMTNAVYNTLNVKIKAESEKFEGHTLGFVVKGRSIAFKGFTAVYGEKQEEERDDDNNKEEAIASIPNLEEGEKLDLADFTSEQKFTKPPARYNDATLVKALEENGIGRPSTYATIISVLAKREYTKKDGKSILPTELGETVCEYMLKFFPEVMNLAFTARMEGALDKIEEGDMEWQEIVENFYPRLSARLAAAVKSPSNVKRPNGEPTDEVCEKCGSPMLLKDGKYGKFLACSNYPQCKNIKSVNDAVGICPVCGKDIVKKKTKAGKVFYGCTGYPDCSFVSWDLPAPKLCPDCNSPMKVTGRSGSKTYVCTNKACNHAEKE